MAISDNPPAFPNDGRIQLGDDYQGMTLRDWFAGQALPEAMRYAFAETNSPIRKDLLPEEGAARIALGIADAMLLARKEN